MCNFREDSHFFLACDQTGNPLGFIQLYPSFSSVAMKSMWYLNDLFVMPNVRGKGVASELLNHVKQFAKDNDSLSLKLATAIDNEAAKMLYQKHGFSKVINFDHYVLRTNTAR
ncbi:GNAT family N-acetyltransferase [Alteromonas confluentis]|uniref:GNAT family N-acetyltransferase n=1 Tax=Alteromonas confluentis TaxID=1656094 RepID=A0A1E7Z985_9ALTE|nr:GNAT family N-acetyltransferase [Alteromonas confluentis]OFC70037.1 GNAT family N-acetyltransferase [Alteromonas confluentis]